MKRYIHILIGVLTVFGVFFTSCEDMENEPLEIQSDIYVWDEDDYTGENAKQVKLYLLVYTCRYGPF